MKVPAPTAQSLPSLEPEATQALLRALFEHAQDAIGISNRNVVRVVNASLLRLFGYDRDDELLGRSFLELMAPEGRETIEGFVRSRERGETVPGMYRTRAIRRDGTAFDVEIRSTTYQQAGEHYALALLRDVGPELAAERAERQSQELYRAIFEANTAIKLLIDPSDGQIVDANPAAAEFYGWSRETLRAMKITQINTLPPEEVAAELESARAGRRRYFRFRHRTASGDVRHVEIHSGTMVVEGRTLLLSILNDVSDRYALEEELAHSRALEAIGRVAGGVAHDFNNLLTVIGTACEGLAQDLGSADHSRQSLGDILHATRRASQLTEQLLAFGGRQVLEMRPAQLNDVVRGVLSLLARAVGGGVALHTSLAPDLPPVSVDPGQLEQVLMNLALNARDAMDGAGRLDIETSLAGAWVSLLVRDDGRGMDAATRARIFEPFFTTKPRGQGTGLGLASAYGIITQIGGQISVESAPGAGAVFKVLLPISLGMPSRPPPRVEGALVLLVDDDPDMRRIMADRLKDAGYRLLLAESSETALALPEDALARVQALVTDVDMPGISGIALATELRARQPDLAVVVISGHASEPSGLPGNATFLQKPFSRRDLVQALRERLAGRSG